jgi:hypothetical protein
VFDAWSPYNVNTKYIKILGTRIDSLLHSQILKDSTFEQNHDKIEDMLSIDTEERLQVVSSANPHTASEQQYNPYLLSTVNHGYEDNNRASRTFDGTQTNVAKNTDYYFYLRRIYSFWYEYLPSLYKYSQDRVGRSKEEQDRYSEGTVSL